MKYRHYAPECSVIIVDGSTEAAARYIKKHFNPGNRVLCFEEELAVFADFSPLSYGKQADTDTLLAGLFAALRELDDPAIGTVFARCPAGSGKAMAVQNRLLKAAGFHRVNAERFVLGITGGTGCGKTTALEAIRLCSGMVIDCDAEYHRLLEQDKELLQAIESRFPGVVVDGKLQRKELGKRVFAQEAELAALNAITHPRVKEAVLDMLPSTPSLVAIDAIGLFEGGLADLCDITVAITAPEEDRIQRLIRREGISREYAAARIAAQRSNEEFSKMCDYTLENDGTYEDFQRKCLAFFSRPDIMKEKP
jgi:L-threonylcarbamoyladenylate synthase